MQIRLNRCKHCNGMARVDYSLSCMLNCKTYRVYCRSCQVYCEHTDIERAARAWNTRMPNKQSDIVTIKEQ